MSQLVVLSAVRQIASMDWTDPDQTNMLVDWVRVYERVQSDSATLIDESGNNLPYNRIINTAEFAAGFVGSDLESDAVEPLVGDQVLELDYYTTLSPEGGATKTYSGALFDFNRIDLSRFTNIIFSVDSTQFENFDDVALQFEDAASGVGTVRTSDYTPISAEGDWNTYSIPFSDFVGVQMDDINILGFFSPNDVNDNLIAGKLYLDDIRFSAEECIAPAAITFDSENYNPDTRVGAVNINDICSANQLASVVVDNGTEEISVGVKLDAAGLGRAVFGLVNGESVCPSDDQASYISLSGALTATYSKSIIDSDGVESVETTMAMAGVDETAPGTQLLGEELYVIASDSSQPTAFAADVDFNFSDFGSGSSFDGNVSDPNQGTVWSIGNSAGNAAVWALFNFQAGFADRETFNFKVKDLPGDEVLVKFSDADADYSVNLITSPFSTDIGNGWYSVSIPMSEFGAIETYNYIVIKSNTSSASTFEFFATDVFFTEKLIDVPSDCEVLAGSSSGGSSTGGSSTGGSSSGVSSSGGSSGSTPGGDFDGGLILDADFNGGGSGWIGNALNVVADGGNNLNTATVESAGDAFNVNLSYVLSITQNETYTLEFKARSDGNRTMLAGIGLNEDPWTNVTETANLTSEWQTFTYSFTATGFGNSNSRVIFDMGADTGLVLIDEVSLVVGTGSSSSGGSSSGGSSSGGTPGGDFDGGLVLDADFNDGGSGWVGNALNVIDDAGNNVNSATVEIAGNPFDVNLSYVLSITQDESYTLEFKARSDGNRTMLAGIGLNEDPWTNFTETANLTSEWQTFTYSFTATGFGGANSRVIFDMGADTGLVLIDEVSLTVDGGGSSSGGSSSGGSSSGGSSGGSTVDLPVNFDLIGVDYELVDFGGVVSSMITDPDLPGNTVVQSIKTTAAELWGGTTVANANGFLTAIPFAADATSMSVRVYSPDAGIPVRLKAEDHTDPTISVETEAMTTVANGWETLTFDFSSEASGTAALNLANSYTKVSIFFNFGTTGADAGEKTYLWDDVEFVTGGGSSSGGSSSGGSSSGGSSSGGSSSGGAPGGDFDGGLVLDADFNDSGAGWVGNALNVIDDAGNNVNSATVEIAGNPFDVNLSYVLSITQDESYTLEFKARSDGNRTMLAGIGLNEDPWTNFTETANLTSEWQTFTYSFTATGFGGANSRVIFDMGADTGLVLIDEVSLTVDGGGSSSGGSSSGGSSSGGSSSGGAPGGDFDGGLVLDADFNDGGSGWVGNALNVIDDAGNNVNSATVEIAGNPFDVNLSYVLSITQDESYTLEFKARSDGNRTMLAGIGLNEDPWTNFTETANLTSEWQTFTYSFTATGFGGANSRVIFDMGADTGLVLIDEVSLTVDGGGSSSGGSSSGGSSSGGSSGGSTVDLPVNFDLIGVDYELVDFGGVVSSMITDPDLPGNTVVQSIKTTAAELWGGTTVANANGFLTAIPFAADATSMSVRVYSPDAGIPVRLKAEDHTDPTISVETEAMTTVANGWETLTFDFSSEASGTAALNLANSYTKVSIFFNFGTTVQMQVKRPIFGMMLNSSPVVVVLQVEAHLVARLQVVVRQVDHHRVERLVETLTEDSFSMQTSMIQEPVGLVMH